MSVLLFLKITCYDRNIVVLVFFYLTNFALLPVLLVMLFKFCQITNKCKTIV